MNERPQTTGVPSTARIGGGNIGNAMTRTLGTPHDGALILSPTTTVTLARRMLAASQAVADSLPAGFYASPVLDTLLALHVAEEDAAYLDVAKVEPAGVAPTIARRWIGILVAQGLVEQRGTLLALTDEGHAAVTRLLEAVYAVQRELD